MSTDRISNQTALKSLPYPALEGPIPPAAGRPRRHAAPPPLPVTQVAEGLPLGSSFAWVLGGNVIYAVCQWGMIVALAKLGDSLMVGQFSLGLAIATPVLMFSNLHLRTVQATDANRAYRFSEYFELRILLTLAAIAVIAGIAWFGKYESRTTMVILAVALAKAIESLSDIHYGLFQLNDRLDQTGRSMILRGIGAVIALSAGLYLTRKVFWACVWLAMAWLVTLVFFDARQARALLARSETSRTVSPTGLRRRWNLMSLALPLGIVTTIASINLNMPRYFIQSSLGEHALGVFSAMAYATVAMTLVSDSLANCVIPRMSRLYAGGQRTEFRSLLLKLLAAAAILGLAGLGIAQAAGPWLLTIVYSAEYAAQARVFVVLMLATAIHFVASMLTTGITSARCFRIQVPIFALMAASNAWVCARWVPKAGLAGGAMGMVAGAAVRLVLAGIVVAYLLSTPARDLPGNPMEWERGL